MLFTLGCSPYKKDLFGLKRIVCDKDELLLWSDGVIGGVANSVFLEYMCNTGLLIYGLKDDIIARGLSGYFSDLVKVADYFDFIRLTERHVHQVAW